jgi:hypothetical protein
MKHFGVLTVVAVAICALAASTASAAAPSSGPAMYVDPIGDAGTAPDISGVAISGTVDGRTSMTISFAGAASWTTPPTVLVALDVDGNANTGGPLGADAALIWSSSDGAAGARWDGSAYSSTTVASLAATYTTGSLTLEFDPHELGSTTGGFGFFVVTSWDGSNAVDDAPDQGLWTYGAGATSVKLQTAATIAPTRAKAGGTYATVMLVTRSDTGGFLGSEGQVTCSATIAGRHSVAPGVWVTTSHAGLKVSAAVCQWHVPRSARGKAITGTVTVSYGGSSVSHRFHAKIH